MESEYIARAVRGDAEAFETLMTAYEKKIYCLCLRMMGNPHDGEDAAQEAMLRIWQKMSQYRGECAFSTWVYRVASSSCMDAIRKRSRQTQPEESVEKKERRENIQRAISSVPEQMRSVFLLRDVHGLSVEETANALQIAQGTVKSRLARAREKIAAELLTGGRGNNREVKPYEV